MKKIMIFLKEKAPWGALFILFILYSYRAMALLRMPMMDASAEWVGMQQTFYLAALFLGFSFLVATPKIAITATISIILGALCERFDVFDHIIHGFLVSKKIYAFFGVPGFAQNPQYSKLIFYAFLAPLILMKFMFSKKRSLSSIFIFGLIFINLAAALIYHALIPDGLMRFENRQDVALIQKMDVFNESEMKKICQQQDFNCRVSEKGKVRSLHQVAMDDSRASRFAQLSAGLTIPMYSLMVDTNNLAGVYAVIKTREGVFYEIYSFKRMEQRWKSSVGFFSVGVWIVSFIWFLLTAFLIGLHRNVRV